MTTGEVAVVVPVYGNAATLPELARRVRGALEGRAWRLRLVIDASPDASLAVAQELAAGDPRIAVTSLDANVGQHRALARGLSDEGAASVWVCLDADLQDPPEAVPTLLDCMACADVGAVFAGRRGAYESPGRLLTGRLHRALVARVTGLPPDAGAFVAMDRTTRDAVVTLNGPSIVAAIGTARVPTLSIPVVRDVRPAGRSAWTPSARVRQSVGTLAWLARRRRQAPSHRWTSTSA